MSRRYADDVIGLIPAAGQASRLAPLPCSKDLYPVGFQQSDGRQCPKPVILYLLEKFRDASVSTVFIVIRQGKWDIPAYLNDGTATGLHLGYLLMGRPFGAPFSLAQAYPFLHEARVAFGFPDILFEPFDAYSQLLRHQGSTQAEVVLGLLPAHDPSVMDMVEIEPDSRVRTILLKPGRTALRYAWVCAIWTPRFTEFLHLYVESLSPVGSMDEVRDVPEWSVGHILQAAVDRGMNVHGLPFPHGRYLDIGTPSNLRQAIQSEGSLGA